jgi:hypothetical protein
MALDMKSRQVDRMRVYEGCRVRQLHAVGTQALAENNLQFELLLKLGAAGSLMYIRHPHTKNSFIELQLD